MKNLNLPDGIDTNLIEITRNAAGFSSLLFFLNPHSDIKSANRSHAVNRGYPTVFLKIILLVGSIMLYFKTEHYLWDQMEHTDNHSPIPIHLNDFGHDFFEPLKQFLI